MTTETFTAVGAGEAPRRQCEEIGMSRDIMAFQHGEGARPEPSRVCQFRVGEQALCGAHVTLAETTVDAIGPTMYPRTDRVCPFAAKMVDEPATPPDMAYGPLT